MKPLQMVDLAGQYDNIRDEINLAIQQVLDSTAFINGAPVRQFVENLSRYLDVKHVIPCGNGTDALQIALMALDLKPGDEVIVPSFSYIASAEAAALLGLIPVFVDVDEKTFNLDVTQLEAALSPKTKAIIPVHLFGQSCDMEAVTTFAKKHELFVIEDNAQAIGSDFRFSSGICRKTGTIGHIGCLSFFPSKNLGAFGDGGAMLTNDDALAEKLRMIANHGQAKKYYHSLIGCNSRLDTLQAAILDVKLKYLDEYIAARQAAAERYFDLLKAVTEVILPKVDERSKHVFHQFTLQVPKEKRDALKQALQDAGIPSMIYYPVPLHRQQAFAGQCRISGELAVSEKLSETVLSLPMHTELTEEMQQRICDKIKEFMSK
ncbi:MAG: DegT/DnrJ/EryC1/StrS family aminotransferase [Bacteroidota bacterium]|nr:DegT/DnrJ/EryC1/StrS family aminotransferase [Bacteroidota bacterium]